MHHDVTVGHQSRRHNSPILSRASKDFISLWFTGTLTHLLVVFSLALSVLKQLIHSCSLWGFDFLFHCNSEHYFWLLSWLWSLFLFSMFWSGFLYIALFAHFLTFASWQQLYLKIWIINKSILLTLIFTCLNWIYCICSFLSNELTMNRLCKACYSYIAQWTAKNEQNE